MAAYDREAWFSKHQISPDIQSTNGFDDALQFEQQVHDMLVSGRLCSWVSVKGRIALIPCISYIAHTWVSRKFVCSAGTPLSERINKIFTTASDIVKKEVVRYFRLLLHWLSFERILLQKLKSETLSQHNQELISTIKRLESKANWFFSIFASIVLMISKLRRSLRSKLKNKHWFPPCRWKSNIYIKSIYFALSGHQCA